MTTEIDEPARNGDKVNGFEVRSEVKKPELEGDTIST